MFGQGKLIKIKTSGRTASYPSCGYFFFRVSFHMPVASVVQLVTSNLSDDVSSSPGAVTRTRIFPKKKKSCPTSGERFIRGYTKFDFAVDQGKGWLDPSRVKV